MNAKSKQATSTMHARRTPSETARNNVRRSETIATETRVPGADLTPGFRDRLIASLDEVGVPIRGRMTYVASLTERAAQTVSRWFDPRAPGLPDLASCARLCEGLGRSSDWLLGLATESQPADAGAMGILPIEIRWAQEVFADLRRGSASGEVMRMSGDEMAPLIGDGDLMFVDVRADRLAGNGIYALEVDGRVVVRRVDSRLGVGLVFKCDNERYPERVVKDAAAARRLGLRVIGKVRGAVGVTHFWPT
ncbi:MAG: S24 family peptidase [Rhizobacter sp.]